jgi:NAD dependent epimerase/dehydratase family enzyme
LRVLYGEMASVVITGQRALPARATERGFEFKHASVSGALAAALDQT